MKDLRLHVGKINSKKYYIEGCIGDLSLFSAEGTTDELLMVFLENPLNIEKETMYSLFAIFHSYFKTKYGKKTKKIIKKLEMESPLFLSELGELVIKEENVKGY